MAGKGDYPEHGAIWCHHSCPCQKYLLSSQGPVGLQPCQPPVTLGSAQQGAVHKGTPPHSLCFFASCMRSLTVWRNYTRMKRRSWRIRRNPWMMKWMLSNRERQRLSCFSPRAPRLEAHRLWKGTKRRKSKCEAALGWWLLSHPAHPFRTGTRGWGDWGLMIKSGLWAVIPLWVTITGLSVSHRTFGFPEFMKLRVRERCGLRGPALPLACSGKFCKVR